MSSTITLEDRLGRFNVAKKKNGTSSLSFSDNFWACGTNHTVDRRNPAPVEIYKPKSWAHLSHWWAGFLTHQQYFINAFVGCLFIRDKTWKSATQVRDWGLAAFLLAFGGNLVHLGGIGGSRVVEFFWWVLPWKDSWCSWCSWKFLTDFQQEICYFWGWFTSNVHCFSPIVDLFQKGYSSF